MAERIGTLRLMAAVSPRFAAFLEFIHGVVPGLESNRVDKVYVAGPSVDGVELSVGVKDQGYSVRLVLTKHRMGIGDAVYDKVADLARGFPGIETEKRPRGSRYTVVVFRRDPFASLNQERAREWIAHWVLVLGGLRDEIVGEGNVAQWRARSLSRAASATSSAEVRRAALARELEAEAARQEREQPFDPATVEDGRQRVLREVVSRQGQQSFRQELIRAYGGRCAISGCTVIDVLEAAHISPYRGPETNHVTNGLLLRADLHTLFDLGRLCVDPETMRLVVADSLKGTEYHQFAGQPLALTADNRLHPSATALRGHLEFWGLRV